MSQIKCNRCGNEQWTKFLETETETRVGERFECDECGAEGRKFTGTGATVHSGAMRA